MEKENKISESLKMDMIKKIFMLTLLVITVILIIVFITNKFNNDGMLQTKGINVKYRTYTKEKGWSKWSKNGMTSGNGKDEIQSIEIKVNSRIKGGVSCTVYQSGNWTSPSIDRQKEINGVKISIYGTIRKKYNIYYRTYNEKDEWLEWSENAEINGNIKQPIKKIEIKVVQRESSREDYLKDYSLNETKSKGFTKIKAGE